MGAMQSSAKTASQQTVSASEAFRARFKGDPTVFRAPGRVNLIGEFTDYNDGFVMPAALDFATYAAVGPREDRELHVYSVDFAEMRVFPLDSPGGAPTQHWSDYVRGVAGVLTARGFQLRGANIAIHGDVPIGAGLSSSAALEVAVALALLHNSGLQVEPREVALICQRAEHQYAGTLCGIMDQFISCFGRSDNALLLDCRSLEYKHLPLSADHRIVICNSCVKHELASSEYNKRRSDCEAAGAFLRTKMPHVRALRDVSLEDLERNHQGMDDVVYRRARHVISENERTVEAASCLASGNIARFGHLMSQSHNSLRDDFEVSCNELDALVSIAARIDGVLGARMTGGGFGGCTVNLVRKDAVDGFRDSVTAAYRSVTGIEPKLYVCNASDGAGIAR
jgi:galactokinase